MKNISKYVSICAVAGLMFGMVQLAAAQPGYGRYGARGQGYGKSEMQAPGYRWSDRGPGYGRSEHGPGYGRSESGPGYGRSELTPGQGQGMAGQYLWIPDLTDEQKEQIKELRVAHLQDVQPLHNELNINRAKLDALMTETSPDLNEINALIEANGQIRTDLQKKAAAHRLEIKDLLTDEQKLFLDTHRGRGRMNPQAHRRSRNRF